MVVKVNESCQHGGVWQSTRQKQRRQEVIVQATAVEGTKLTDDTEQRVVAYQW